MDSLAGGESVENQSAGINAPDHVWVSQLFQWDVLYQLIREKEGRVEKYYWNIGHTWHVHLQLLIPLANDLEQEYMRKMVNGKW